MGFRLTIPRFNDYHITSLDKLMGLTEGSPEVTVGIIDGPADLTHNSLRDSHIKVLENKNSKCTDGYSCIHGTFIFGLLASHRDSTVPGICPKSRFVLNSIFHSDNSTEYNMPFTTPQELAVEIIRSIDEGCRIINLSLGLNASSLNESKELIEAFSYAFNRDVIIVVASGNQGDILSRILFSSYWPIPVSSCESNAKIISRSNFGPSASTRGIMAPGVNIKSLAPENKYNVMSGTSVSAAIVTGSIALLWSQFPTATASEIKYSIINTSKYKNKKTIIPNLLDLDMAWKYLKSNIIE